MMPSVILAPLSTKQGCSAIVSIINTNNATELFNAEACLDHYAVSGVIHLQCEYQVTGKVAADFSKCHVLFKRSA